MSQNPVQLLKSLVTLLSTTVGRDKTCRVVQYVSKFVAAVLRHQIAKGTITKEQFDELTSRIERLSGNMSLTRKVLRFGRPIGLSFTLIDLIKQLKTSLINPKSITDIKQSPFYISMKIGSTISLILFFLLDHILYFGRVDLMKKNPELTKFADFYSSFWWFLDCLFGLTSNVLEIKHLFELNIAERLSSNENKNEKIKTNKARIDAAIVDAFRNIFDIPVAVGFMYPQLVSPGTIGVFGAITSYIGCYQNWK
ncbi:hypothetical protein ABPG74_003523 [Tetrahymena malaccensis]